MISRSALSLLLFTAGVTHLLKPELFDAAIPFDGKLEINILSAILEICLALGLWIPSLKDFTARMTALWFLLLTPIHIYISVLEIPMFGVSHPLFLWGRTLFQAVLFFWALSLQDIGWMISQHWSDVLFLHYEVDPKALQEKVPYPIDLFERKAVVSIVPFVMSRIRFPFLPAIPGFSKLYELNLRTYVRVNNKPAVYFFTLDSNHLPGVLVARFGFSLPYRWKQMQLSYNESYDFQSQSLQLSAKIEDAKDSNDFNSWSTERYALVTKFFGRDLWGVVEHDRWVLQKAHIQNISDHFSSEFISVENFMGAAYAKNLSVRFRPFRFLKSGDQHGPS